MTPCLCQPMSLCSRSTQHNMFKLLSGLSQIWGPSIVGLKWCVEAEAGPPVVSYSCLGLSWVRHWCANTLLCHLASINIFHDAPSEAPIRNLLNFRVWSKSEAPLTGVEWCIEVEARPAIFTQGCWRLDWVWQWCANTLVSSCLFPPMAFLCSRSTQ